VVAWTTAYDAAANRTWMGSQGHLATITSAAENEFLKSLPWSDLSAQFPSSHGAFIGGTLAGDSWQWVTGEAWNYTHWYTGQPNGGNATPRLHYYNQWDAATYPDRFGTWNDMSSDNPIGPNTGSLGYIVEYEPTAPPQNKTHVLSIGVQGDWLSGGTMANRVASAFGQIGSVQRGSNVSRSLTWSGGASNDQILRDEIAAAKDRVSPGDTFVFYINCHGVYDHGHYDGLDPLSGDETPVNAQFNSILRYQREDTTGDENLLLGEYTDSQGNKWQSYISDDGFAALFDDPKWDSVNKLFIIDSCYSGGFAGHTDQGDSGDLSSLPRFALIAASDEADFAGSHFDLSAGGWVGNLGSSLVDALGDLTGEEWITYDELYESIHENGSFLVGSTGRLLTFDVGDNWSAEYEIESFELGRTLSNDFAMGVGVPEPATVGLLTVGAMALLRRRRQCQ